MKHGIACRTLPCPHFPLSLRGPGGRTPLIGCCQLPPLRPVGGGVGPYHSATTAPGSRPRPLRPMRYHDGEGCGFPRSHRRPLVPASGRYVPPPPVTTSFFFLRGKVEPHSEVSVLSPLLSLPLKVPARVRDGRCGSRASVPAGSSSGSRSRGRFPSLPVVGGSTFVALFAAVALVAALSLLALPPDLAGREGGGGRRRLRMRPFVGSGGETGPTHSAPEGAG